MRQRFMLLGILSVLALGSALPASAVSDAMEDVQYPSPLEQYNAGVALHEIQCNEPRDLYVTGSDVPVCLYQDTYQALLDRGVSLSLPPTLESVIQTVIEDTIALYESDPDGAFAAISAMMSSNPSYPFVIDSDGIVVAHGANPNRIGVNSVLVESTGMSAEMLISELEDGEMWVEYTFANPSTGAEQHKRSLIMSHDGYIFGSGYYPLPESIVRSVVDETISLYDSDPDGAFAAISAMMSSNPSYPFVGDSDADLVAHGSNPDLVGQSILTLIKYDMTLETFISELQEGEFWYEYTFHNPATGTEQHKRALFVLYDGHIFGSGYYTAPSEAMTGDAMTDDEMMMADAMSSLDLTPEEVAWLEENGTIRVTYNSAWFPLEYADESGNFAGVMLEYAKEFSRQTGAEFVGTQSATIWDDVVGMVRDDKADVMFSVISLPERLEYMDFTSTHYSIETRIVTVNDRQISMDEADVKLLTIRGYDIASWLDENHPDLEYVVVDSFGEAFEMLSAGDGDALVSTWPVASYHAAQAGIDNIYDAGPTGYQYDLRVGYSNQNPVLGSILQKVVDNIPASQIEQWYADATP